MNAVMILMRVLLNDNFRIRLIQICTIKKKKTHMHAHTPTHAHTLQTCGPPAL